MGLALLLLPPPGGLAAGAWHYVALFVAVVVALICEPVPGPVAGLAGITLAAVFRLVAPTPSASVEWALTGFADSTVWLMFVAFTLALGYEKTGLGRRIALMLVHRLGRRTLGLGYAIALTDLVLAPFVPSNTARSGGIVFPIIEGVPRLYGSWPGEGARRIGGYVMWTAFTATCVTSSMFLTALAPNLIAVSLMREIAGVRIGWTDWFLGFLPVGVPLFLLVPLLVYVIYPPEVRVSPEVPQWAAQELARIGRISRQESLMAALALLALVLWIFGGRWISATAVALLTLCLMILTGVVTWSDVLGYRQAWSNLVWFATLITLANGLGKVGFLGWFAGTATSRLGGLPGPIQVGAIVALFFVSHYMFASLTAHTTAVLPVMLAAAVAMPGVPVAVLSMALSYALGLMGVLSPYATGSAPIYYGSGYITHREFWLLGLVFGAIFLGALLLLGVPYLAVLRG